MTKDIIVAIDGYSGVGKSSTARAVAQRLAYNYIDTGAMYRAVTLYFLRQRVNIAEPKAVQEALANVTIRFRRSSERIDNITYLNGQDVEQEIRGMEVSQYVSPVSALPAVRQAMVAQQRAMGNDKRIVMDGRDIGTNVFPQAELKVFMQANTAVRAERRRAELLAKGQDVSIAEIAANLTQRDEMDASRKENPLTKAKDAVVVDTTHLTFDQQVQQVVALAYKIIDA